MDKNKPTKHADVTVHAFGEERWEGEGGEVGGGVRRGGRGSEERWE